MPNYDITYSIDYGPLREFVTLFTQYMENGTSETVAAVEAAGNHVIGELIETGNVRIKHSSGGFARGIISGAKYPYEGDNLFFMIEPEGKIYALLEEGYAGFDMKKALQTSHKVRMSEDGTKFLIIPFRHGVPGTKGIKAMPEEVYNEATFGRFKDGEFVITGSGAKNMKQSSVVDGFTEGSIKGAANYQEAAVMRLRNPERVDRRIYEWGERLHGVDQPKLKEHHATNIFEGMVRMQSNPNKNREQYGYGQFAYDGVNQTDNQMDSSQYMTFRVMSEKSKGWIHPGMKGLYIFRDVKQKAEQNVVKIISEGVEKDIKLFFDELGLN